MSRLIDLFLRDGFSQQSLEDFAQALHCSKSTLYQIASSKEQVILTTLRGFFRRAAGRVERRIVSDTSSPVDRIHSYLMAISEELAPASPAFFADLDAAPSAREIYQENTRIAADRLQELVREALPGASSERALFVGAVATQVMEAIHRGEIETATGLDDSAAYRALADLIIAGIDSAATEGEE